MAAAMSSQIKMGLASGGRIIKTEFDAAFLFLPFNSFHPLRLYLFLATSVILYRDRSIICKCHYWHLLLLGNLLKTVYLSLFLPPYPLDRIRLADIMYITTGEDLSYQIWTLLQAFLLYLNYTLFTVKPVFLSFLVDLLFSKGHPLLKGISTKSRSPLKNVKESALWALNLIGILKIISDILFLIVLATILNEAIRHPGDLLGNPLVSPFLFIGRILQVFLGLTGLFLALFLYSTVCPNVAAVGSASITLLFLCLHRNAKQLTAWMRSFRKKHFTWSPFARYRAYSLKTFSLLFIANQVLGRIFVAFLFINLPISAVCFVYLTFGGLNIKTILTLILIMLQGLTCTLIIHWFLARLTQRLHAPSKVLLALSTLTSRRKGKGNFRARLTLHLAICHLHTDRKYGFTYGCFGLVTMGSFGKCMIIYSELIIYSYKLIIGI